MPQYDIIIIGVGLVGLATAWGLKQKDSGLRILPFRGEFYKVTGASEHVVKGLIYPVPDLRYPFLGIHLTRVIGDGPEAVTLTYASHFP